MRCIAISTIGCGMTLAIITLRVAPLLTLTTVGNRLGFNAGVESKARDFHHRQVTVDDTLDIGKQLQLVHTHQGHRLAAGAGASGTADAVHVVFRHIGQFKIHHVG